MFSDRSWLVFLGTMYFFDFQVDLSSNEVLVSYFELVF